MRLKGVDDGQQVNIPAPCTEGYYQRSDASSKRIVPLVVHVGFADQAVLIDQRNGWRPLEAELLPKFVEIVPRKPSLGRQCVPVLKLTQVGEASSLRGSREPSLRN